MIPAWVEEHCKGRVYLTSRAKTTLKRAQYTDVGLAAIALSILAEPYWNLRTQGGEAHRSAFETALGAQGLRLTRSTTELAAGQWGDTYWVKSPDGDENRFMEWHLAKGNSRDPRYCFRCYFYWDEANNKVVVGSLPNHLCNSLT
jgi:hypothetical protein